MFWGPYRSSELKTINAWFEQPKPSTKNMLDMKNTFKTVGTFFKNLFFDRTIVKKLRAQRLNKNMLSKYLQEGKISMNEYLYLSR
jgi:hypothetical protein